MLLGVPLLIVFISLTIVGIVALAGGFAPAPTDPNFPKPAGYRFEDWHLAKPIMLCVDPRGGPDITTPLLELTQRAVGEWQTAASGHVPLSVGGICKSAGGDQDNANPVRWAALSPDRSGEAYVHFDEGGGVTDATIRLTTAMVGPSDACLLMILEHEVGHVIGMAHQLDTVVSIMRAPCGATLSWADVAAVRYRYH